MRDCLNTIILPHQRDLPHKRFNTLHVTNQLSVTRLAGQIHERPGGCFDRVIIPAAQTFHQLMMRVSMDCVSTGTCFSKKENKRKRHLLVSPNLIDTATFRNGNIHQVLAPERKGRRLLRLLYGDTIGARGHHIGLTETIP